MGDFKEGNEIWFCCWRQKKWVARNGSENWTRLDRSTFGDGLLALVLAGDLRGPKSRERIAPDTALQKPFLAGVQDATFF